MANRFWVGGGSSTAWSATGNTNWATTSGGANNASVPTTTDVAIFDSNSGTGNSVMSTSFAIQGLDCTGGTGDYAGTITHNNAITLTINTGAANSLRLSAGMTYSPANASSAITFAHTSGTASLTSNGKLFPALNINGVGGTTALADDLFVNRTAGAILNVLAGTFDANGKNVTASIFSSTGSGVRTVTMGSGLWTVGVNNTTATANIWNFSTITNLTFNKNTANVKITGSTITNRSFIGNGQTFNDLTIEANSSDGIIAVTGANTFGAITITGRCALVLPVATTTATSLSATGVSGAPVMLVSAAIGTAATLSIASGTTTFTWGGIRDITGSGGANFNATDTLNFGGNTGWTIANPSDVASPTSIATAVWQDTTASDFTVSGSIGKDLKTGAVPGSANGMFIAGSNAATTVNITGNITGNLTGSVGSVTALSAAAIQSIWDALTSALTAVGSVGKLIVTNLDAAISSRMATYTQPTGFLAATFPATVASPTNITTVGAVSGNVGGNVVGSVASVTARVTANVDQIAGSSTGATNLSKTTNVIARGTVGSGSSTTSVVTSAFTPAGAVADQFKNRAIIFDADTATIELRGQAREITASSNAATPTLTVAALTTAPSSGDTFSLS